MKYNKTLGVRLLLFCFCFCFTSCTQEEVRSDGEGTPVSFTLPDIDAGVEEDAVTRVSVGVDKDTKIRVVVYRTGAQSNANYVTTKDYTVQADGTLVTTDGSDLRLIDGTYDFYAITPHLAVNTSGNSPTVSVPQRNDFAVSLTTNQRIAKWSGSGENSSTKRHITLNELVRKCAKVNFAIDLANDVAPGISDTKIVEAKLTAMPAGPLLTSGTAALSPSSGTATLTFLADMFTTDATNPRKASGSTVLLPKTKGAFTLSMKAQFNGATSITTQFPAATISAMTLDAGKEYTFTVRLTKDKMGNTTAGLWVTVSKWLTNNQEVNLGGVPTGPIVVMGVSDWYGIVNYNPGLGSDNLDENN